LVTWKWLDAEGQRRQANLARHDAEQASAQAVQEAHEAKEARRKARDLATSLVLDQGALLCQRGEVGRGMLFFASGLSEDADADPALQRALRANLSAWRPHSSSLADCLKQDGDVLAIACSPDGKWLATCGEGSRVR